MIMGQSSCRHYKDIHGPSHLATGLVLLETDFIAQCIDLCSKWIVLEESRTEFIRQHSLIIFQLINNVPIIRTLHRTALIGPKNIGKTLLLTSFANAIKSTVGDYIIVLELECYSSSPKRNLCKVLNISLESDWQDIEIILNARRLRVLFIFDEFELVFTLADPNKAQIYLREALYINENTSGLFHSILSESSVLRKLLTEKLDNIDRCHTHYNGTHFTGVEFSFHTVLPFNCQSDFQRLVDFFITKYRREPSKFDHLDEIFLCTYGYPGFVQNYLRTYKYDNYSPWDAFGRLSNTADKVLKYMVVIVRKTPTVHYESVVFDLVKLIDVDSFDRHIASSIFEELSDLGLVVFIRKEQGKTKDKVGFFSSLLYLKLVTVICGTPSSDLVSLLRPVGVNDAQSLFFIAEILMKPTHDLLVKVFDIHETRTYCRYSIPRLQFCECDSQSKGLSFNDLQWGIFLWEYNITAKLLDDLGADLVFLEKSGRVHRVRLMLGMSKLEEEDFDKISNNFRVLMSAADAAYRRAGLTLEGSRHYLITTRPFNPKHAEKFQKDFVLIDCSLLKKHNVWPEEVRALGGPFR